MEYGEPVRGLRPVRTQMLDATTDASGAAVFCGLPAGVDLDLRFPQDNERISPLGTFRIGADRISTEIVRTRKP